MATRKWLWLCLENIGKFNVPPNDNVAVTRSDLSYFIVSHKCAWQEYRVPATNSST